MEGLLLRATDLSCGVTDLHRFSQKRLLWVRPYLHLGTRML